jgi:hypothetical protein
MAAKLLSAYSDTDWIPANNLMHAAVDNIYEFSKRFIGIFLKYLQMKKQWKQVPKSRQC